MKRLKLYWGMHFCNPRMFKTVVRVEMYERSKIRKNSECLSNNEEGIQYYMTEYGQIFKFDKIKFESYELDLQNMLWFQNQDFIVMYLNGHMKYTEIKEFVDYYKYRKNNEGKR